MGLVRRTALAVVLFAVAIAAFPAEAQSAQAIVERAVQAELAADKADHSRWRFLDDEREKGTVSIVVQTDAGSVKRVVARDGKPLDAAQMREEDHRLEQMIHDTGRLARQRRDSEADDRSAAELIHMLPEAFTWKVTGEDAENVTLHFEPNPVFDPPTMQAHVLGAMRGELVVNRTQQRIRTIRGTLTQDVTFGFGLLGRMKKDGTFQVERREIAPGLWQITETHVHIDGKALLFKSIGEQQDELQTQFRRVPGGTTLEQAVELSRPDR